MGMFWRSYAAFFFGAAWVVGYCIISPLAYLIPYWRHLVVVASFPSCVLGVFYYFTIPESYHYMVSKGKSKDLSNWLKNLNRFKKETELSAEILISEHMKHQKSDGSEDKNFFVQLISHKRILFYTFVLSYLWVCDTFVYYGLSLFSTELAGNKFWNYILSGLIELPSYAVSPYLLNKIGRRLFVSLSHFLAAFSFLGTIFVESPTVSLLLWLTGKFGISCAFTCLFVYASEVFPTNLRSGCIGACEVLARLGGVFAPQANELVSL
uniref:MFS domain-containing protein n=1 Tax=Bursaphelenchus xylophilus TaxID=6326 RepID=A0A1I7SIW3_BURXY